MPENLMNKAHKATNKNFRDNYDAIFRKKPLPPSDAPITKEEIEEFKKIYAVEGHMVIGSNPPRPVVLDDKTAEYLMRSRRRQEEWLNSIHPSHEMNEWHTEVRSPCGTPRFYGVRQCIHCEGEQAQHPAGRFIDPWLLKPCLSKDN
jgi:hypothetical protein